MIEVMEFINNFKEGFDSKGLEQVFTNGNCYHFALILKELFMGIIYYNLDEGHFITRIDDKYYDITGEVKPSDLCYRWSELSIIEPDQYRVIKNNCVYKIRG